MLLGKIEVEVLEGWRLREKESGLIFPWYTWPSLDWLKGLDMKGKNIFEYGVGDSTLWYRAKGALCYGVDNNAKWADTARAHHCETKENYINAIRGFVNFDIVVIDGIYRDECAYWALEYLKPGGYLIIDNWKQPSVEPDWPMTEKLIEGMPITVYKQPNHPDWQTAVITKP